MYVSELFKFAYLYWHNYKQSDIVRELGISNKTSVKNAKYCRKVSIDLATIDPESEKIGGPGKTVEIDESVMEKRKTEIRGCSGESNATPTNVSYLRSRTALDPHFSI